MNYKLNDDGLIDQKTGRVIHNGTREFNRIIDTLEYETENIPESVRIRFNIGLIIVNVFAGLTLLILILIIIFA